MSDNPFRRSGPFGGAGPDDFGGTDEDSHFMSQTRAADLVPRVDLERWPETWPLCAVCGKGPREGNHATDLGEGHDYVPANFAVLGSEPVVRVDRCTACQGKGEIPDPFTHVLSSCVACCGSGQDCSDRPKVVRASDPDAAPDTPRVPPEVREARENGISAIKRAAIREIETGNGPGRALDPTGKDDYERVVPDARSPSDLVGALAMAGLRRLEKGLHDADPRVSFEAARVIGTVASRMAEVPAPPGSDVVDPEARKAALVAALGTPAVIAIVLEVLNTDGTALRAALHEDGWEET